MAFKMKGNPMQRNFGKYVKQYKKLPGINAKSEGDTDLKDGRSPSSPFQKPGVDEPGPIPGEPGMCLVPDDNSPAQKHDDEEEGTRSKTRPTAEAKKVSADDAEHATALYRDQWKDRHIADYDKQHGRADRAKEMRADAELDRKREYAMDPKWNFCMQFHIMIIMFS